MSSPVIPADPPRLLSLGDAAWTVEFGRGIDAATHARVLGFDAALAHAIGRGEFDGVIEAVPTFRSLTVHFDPDRIDGEALGARLEALARTAGSATAVGARWRIPVCCDEDFALDLADVASAKRLSRDAVLGWLTGTIFKVYLLGFLPGYAFMGGLPAALELPRRASPRKRVPAGSVAIAQRLCGVYPWESPGGWHVLGRTPIALFDLREAPWPALLAPGDEVRWQLITRADYERLQARCAAGGFDRSELRMADGGPA